ncbi:hypothetical protein VB716_13585 [Synechococcus sp. CCY9201]|jgi:hypothetical protein|nr:hypothetical protein [Synechococcus sp. CCY9202]MEA5475250.1 hypothetical protein [Synechococcus sp. CCY9201]QPN61896.1 hypothetical protein H8F24_10790 [Synechococcus sp. CBW1002]CAK6699532.1 hypothetical protein IFHNHDMJ_02656 [Synechococcus sp. CBW1107]
MFSRLELPQPARAIARPFRTLLQLDLERPVGLDTDQLGSFDGRRPRPGGAEDACRRKAQLGMDILGLPLGLASEGSFSSHPALPILGPA